jgi:hypothetical protein
MTSDVITQRLGVVCARPHRVLIATGIITPPKSPIYVAVAAAAVAEVVAAVAAVAALKMVLADQNLTVRGMKTVAMEAARNTLISVVLNIRRAKAL